MRMCEGSEFCCSPVVPVEVEDNLHENLVLMNEVRRNVINTNEVQTQLMGVPRRHFLHRGLNFRKIGL